MTQAMLDTKVATPLNVLRRRTKARPVARVSAFDQLLAFLPFGVVDALPGTELEPLVICETAQGGCCECQSQE